MRAVTTERDSRICRAASAKLRDSATRTKVSMAEKRSMGTGGLLGLGGVGRQPQPPAPRPHLDAFEDAGCGVGVAGEEAFGSGARRCAHHDEGADHAAGV